MKEYLDRFQMTELVGYYYQFVDDVKQFDDISIYEIYKALNAYFKENLDVFIKTKELREVAKLKAIAKEIKTNNTYEALTSEFDLDLLFQMIFEDIKKVDDKLIMTIDEKSLDYIINYEVSLADEEADYFLYVLKGMIEVYGALSYKEIDELYAEIRLDKFKAANEPINSKAYVFTASRGNLVNQNIQDDGILHHQIGDINNYKLGEVSTTYEVDYYYDFGYYGMPQGVYTAFDLADNLDLLQHKGRYFQHLINTNKGPIDLDDFVKQVDEKELAEDILMHWPIWAFGGTLPAIILEDGEGLPLVLTIKLETFNFELATFANRRHNYIKNFDTFVGDPFYEIIKSIMKNKRVLNFFQRSPRMPKSEFSNEFLNAYKNALYLEEVYAYQMEAGKLLVYADGVTYHITGPVGFFVSELASTKLPVMVKIIILPLKEYLTVPFAFESSPITISENTQAKFKAKLDNSVHIKNYQDLLAYRKSKT